MKPESLALKWVDDSDGGHPTVEVKANFLSDWDGRTTDDDGPIYLACDFGLYPNEARQVAASLMRWADYFDGGGR